LELDGGLFFDGSDHLAMVATTAVLSSHGDVGSTPLTDALQNKFFCDNTISSRYQLRLA